MTTRKNRSSKAAMVKAAVARSEAKPGAVRKKVAKQTGKKAGKQTVYERVTDKLVSLLESGVNPWNNPMTVLAGGPANMISGKAYRGINTLLLGCEAMVKGYDSNYWLTHKQATERGGTLKPDQKATMVVFWNWIEKQDKETGKKDSIPFLRYYNVFNVNQWEGLTVPEGAEAREHTPIEKAESIVAGYQQPKYTELSEGAYYSPSRDTVNVPRPEHFKSGEAYYSTLFHEMVHSTGHKDRLNRFKGGESFGSKSYSKEELVAEMGASFLSGHAGIFSETADNSAAYLSSWIKALKGDSKLAVSAAGQAQKAADMILGVTFDK